MSNLQTHVKVLLVYLCGYFQTVELIQENSWYYTTHSVWTQTRYVGNFKLFWAPYSNTRPRRIWPRVCVRQCPSVRANITSLRNFKNRTLQTDIVLGYFLILKVHSQCVFGHSLNCFVLTFKSILLVSDFEINYPFSVYKFHRHYNVFDKFT